MLKTKNIMYNEKIEKLIDLALADGELTEKEKQVLFKNAEAQGIDLDEFEMVLDAKLHQQNKSKKTEAAPKSDRVNDVKKCPACGAIIESFSVVCKDCGCEIRHQDSSKTIKDFTEKLAKIPRESNSLLKHGERNPEYKEFITAYPIPNSKEDLLEFATLIMVRCEDGTDFQIWRAKMKEVVLKAKIAMKNDKSSLEIILGFEEEISKLNKNVLKRIKGLSKKEKMLLGCVVYMVAGVILGLCLL